MRKLILLLTALLLLTVFCASAGAAGDHPAGSVVVNSPKASYPQDADIAGDLVLIDDCPSEIVLVNVKVGGKICVDADHTVTVRLQGTSSCAGAVISSAACLYGSGWTNVTVEAPLVQMYGSTDILTVKRENALCVLDGSVDRLTLAAPGIAVGGAGRAESAVILAENCSADIECGELRRDVEEKPTVQARLEATPVVTPADSVIQATITFTDVPAEFEGDYLLQWYFGQTQVAIFFTYRLMEGQTSSITCSAHFPEQAGDTIPVWVQLTPKDKDAGEVLRFSTQVAFTVQQATILDVKYPYTIEINRKQCVVLIYALDDDGEYTKLVQCFLCSVGRGGRTPTGKFPLGAQHRWHRLLGGVYGQYTSQINGGVLFHSVPNYEQLASSLEWDQYNKLGTPASAGCVRVCVQDVKWIYDNCVPGTKVNIYDSDDLPVVKPIPITIEKDYTYRGWDPTDPDPDNPTRAKDPVAPLSLYSLRPLRAEPYVK